MRQQVKSDPSAIGFLSNYQAGLGGLNVVSYNGVACNLANAKRGHVRRRRTLLRGDEGPCDRPRCDVHLVDRPQQGGARKIISSQWIPIS